MTRRERVQVNSCTIVTGIAAVLWHFGVDSRTWVGVFLILLTVAFFASEKERANQRAKGRRC